MIKKLTANRILSIALLLPLVFSACGRNNYNHIETNLSGTYVYQKVKGQGDVTSRFFFVSDMVDGGPVILEQRDDILKIIYERSNGHKQENTYYLNSEEFYWHDGMLVYEKRKIPRECILPGCAVQTQNAKLYKDQNGNLVIDSSFTEKGLMLFIIPFKDSYKSTLMMRKG